MHIVEISIPQDDLVDRMSGMRVWLDSRHVEPAVFRYRHIDSSVIFEVEFAAEKAAAAFAAEFGGRVDARSP